MCAIATTASSAPQELTRANPFDYQRQIIGKARELFKCGHGFVTVVSPTGSGKSFIVRDIASAMYAAGRHLWYIAPRKLLCYGVGEKLADERVMHGYHMSDEPRTSMMSIQLACMPSFLSLIKFALRPNADLIIFDEAHLSQDGILAVRKSFPKTRMLGLTATPLPGMDRYASDEAVIYGPSVAELIERGVLVPIKYYSFEHDGQTSDVLRGGIISTWLRLGEQRPTAVYCKNRNKARWLYRSAIEGGIKAEYMDGETPDTERQEIRKRMEAGVSNFLVTVEVLAYGVDWPFLSCAVLAYTEEAALESTQTKLAGYIQRVGRVIRACPGKRDAIVIDHTGIVRMFKGVEEPRLWPLESLKLKEFSEKERLEVEKERKPITCRSCGHKFTKASICPKCKTPIVREATEEDIEHVEATFVEVDFTSNVVRGTWTKSSADRAYAELLHYVRGKGYKDGSAWHMYEKLATGFRAPYANSTTPLPPSPAIAAFIKETERKRLASFYIKQKYSKKSDANAHGE